MGLFDKIDKAPPRPDLPKFEPVPQGNRKRWTKEEIKTLIKLWPNHTLAEVCHELQRTPSGVGNIVHALRKMGVKLEPKRMPAPPFLKDKIIEALDELGLPHN